MQISDGRNRQVRLLCARAGLVVLRLVRVALGPLLLGALPAGQCRALSAEELALCYAAVGGVEGSLPGVLPLPCEYSGEYAGLSTFAAGAAGSTERDGDGT